MLACSGTNGRSHIADADVGNEKYTLFVKDLSTGKQLLSRPIEVSNALLSFLLQGIPPPYPMEKCGRKSVWLSFLSCCHLVTFLFQRLAHEVL